MPEAEKNHWIAVGYFFHSYWYMELINRFGDVPWVDTVIDPESDEAYGPRTPRDVVAQNIMDRLKWAEENIGDFTDRDGTNSITKECVQLILSRFTLREGTWRKYHNLGDSEEHLQECVRVSAELMDKEAILNYAEAACELGQFNQAAADRSINRLRDRAGVAHMVVADIDENFDPNRDKGNNAWWSGSMPDYPVDPLLWEVRRERIIELMGEGFGFYDVRRWAKAPYFVNRQEKGMWWNRETSLVNNTKGILNESTHLRDDSMTEGYIYVQPYPIMQGLGWIDQYYLYCVPTEELLLNSNLTQNPGWPTASSN